MRPFAADPARIPVEAILRETSTGHKLGQMSKDRLVHDQNSTDDVDASNAEEDEPDSLPEIDLQGPDFDQAPKPSELLKPWLSGISKEDLRGPHEFVTSSSGTLHPRSSTTLRDVDVDFSNEDGVSHNRAVQDLKDLASLVPQELMEALDQGTTQLQALNRLPPAHEALIAVGAILPSHIYRTAVAESQPKDAVTVGTVLPSDQSRTVVTESQAGEDRAVGFDPPTLVVYPNANAKPKSCCAKCDTGSEIHIMAAKIAKRFTGLSKIEIGAGDGMIMDSDVERVQGHSRHDCLVIGVMKLNFYLDQEGKSRTGPYRDLFYILSDDDVQGNFDVMMSEKFVKKYRMLEQDGTRFGLAFKGTVVKIGHTIWGCVTKSFLSVWTLGGSVIVASAACCVTSRRRLQRLVPSRYSARPLVTLG